MMKFLMVLGLVVLCFVSTAIEARTFTNTEGVEIDAEIIRVTGENVTLKRLDNQREYTFPILSLSEEDRQFVLRWKLENPEIRLRFTAVKESGNSRTERFWRVEVQNLTREKLPPLTVSYKAVVQRISKALKTEKSVAAEVDGVAQLDGIEPLRSVEFDTKAVHLHSENSVSETRLGSDYIQKTITNYRDDLIGLNIEVHFKGRLVAEFTKGPYEELGVEKGMAPAGDPRMRGRPPGFPPGFTPPPRKP